MKKKKKTFDCVEMKNRIQSQLLKKWAGKSDAEIRQEIYDQLKNSRSSTAVFWRKMRKNEKSKSLISTD